MTQFNALIEGIFSDAQSDELAKRLALWRFKTQKLVFTHGYFDVIHKGHIEYLAKAAELGDVLVVGLHTDDSARQIKGELTQDEYSRATILSSLQFVKAVVFFEGNPTSLIETIKPDVLVAGAEYNPKTLPGYDFVTQNGGEVITIETMNSKDTPGILTLEPEVAEAGK